MACPAPEKGQGYTDEDWRRLVWGYYRLIERADRFVGAVLNALRESGQEENTVVIFVSDHGDCHGAHRWNQKTVFYDESARVLCRHRDYLCGFGKDHADTQGLDMLAFTEQEHSEHSMTELGQDD